MRDMMRMAAGLAMLGVGMGGYSARDRIRVRACGPVTPEELAEREAKRKAAAERAEQRRIDAADRKAKWQAVYDPQYPTEPIREDFPSRQAFRAAHRKWQTTP